MEELEEVIEKRLFILLLNQIVSDVASKRLKALQRFSDLGAGFIASSDLEIRGAGNIIGGDQSRTWIR